AAGGVLELHFLLDGGVGGVVAGNDLDRPVAQPRAHGGHIFGAAQGRIDLAGGFEALEALVGEQEVVGGRLGRDPGASLPGLADDADGAGGADVADVDGGAHVLGDQDAPHHHDVLGDGGDPRHAELRRDETLVHEA